MSAANNASEIAPALHHATRFSTFMILSSSLPLLAAAPGQGLRGCATARSNPRRSAQGRYQRILLRAGTELISEAAGGCRPTMARRHTVARCYTTVAIGVDLAGTGADNALATPRKQASCPPGLDSPANCHAGGHGCSPVLHQGSRWSLRGRPRRPAVASSSWVICSRLLPAPSMPKRLTANAPTTSTFTRSRFAWYSVLRPRRSGARKTHLGCEGGEFDGHPLCGSRALARANDPPRNLARGSVRAC